MYMWRVNLWNIYLFGVTTHYSLYLIFLTMNDFLFRLKTKSTTPSDEFLVFFILISIWIIFSYILYLITISKIKLCYIKRFSKVENRYNKNMGRLISNVTYIKKYFIGIPIKTIHKYRTTYYGEIKNTKDCDLNK